MNDDAIANLKNGQIKNPNTTRLLANWSLYATGLLDQLSEDHSCCTHNLYSIQNSGFWKR